MWVAILVKDTYSFTQVRKDDDGRFLQVEIDIDRNKLRFVSLYAPNKNPVQNTFFANLPGFVDPAWFC
jgi:exonuclease III